jgi:hypothetical protein
MKKLNLVVLAMSAVLALAPAVAFACGSDSDCKVGHCSSGQCGHCGSDSDCKGWGHCSSGMCNSCGSDSDCAVGHCSGGKCGSCGSDSDCKGGRCSSGKCSNKDDFLKSNRSGPSALLCTP